jgi:hypothetical protein
MMPSSEKSKAVYRIDLVASGRGKYLTHFLSRLCRWRQSARCTIDPGRPTDPNHRQDAYSEQTLLQIQIASMPAVRFVAIRSAAQTYAPAGRKVLKAR